MPEDKFHDEIKALLEMASELSARSGENLDIVVYPDGKGWVSREGVEDINIGFQNL